MPKFLTSKIAWFSASLLVLIGLWFLTLHNIFASSIFASDTILNDIDSAQPISVEIPKQQRQNPWTAKMMKSLIGTKQQRPSHGLKSYIRPPRKKKKPQHHSEYQQGVMKKHKPFTFLQGMDAIKQEYNKSVSNLQPIHALRPPSNPKCGHKGRVFVLGIMKTGTTSMVKALNHLGYHCTHDSCIHLGNWFHFIDTVHLWQPLEVIILSILNMTDLLYDAYIKETNSALAFGDSPWCFLYPVWDKFYPNSKYILMTRKDDQTYINSYLRYLKKYGKNFVNKGLSNEQFALLALRRYHLHNEMVREYFKDRPQDLLEIKVGIDDHEDDKWQPIVEFLGCQKPKRPFPHENKSNRKGRSRFSFNRFTPLKIDTNDDQWNWKLKWGDNIPYVIRNDKDESHSLLVDSPQEFVFDWNLFLVDDLREPNTLSKVRVKGR